MNNNLNTTTIEQSSAASMAPMPPQSMRRENSSVSAGQDAAAAVANSVYLNALENPTPKVDNGTNNNGSATGNNAGDATDPNRPMDPIRAFHKASMKVAEGNSNGNPNGSGNPMRTVASNGNLVGKGQALTREHLDSLDYNAFLKNFNFLDGNDPATPVEQLDEFSKKIFENLYKEVTPGGGKGGPAMSPENFAAVYNTLAQSGQFKIKNMQQQMAAAAAGAGAGDGSRTVAGGGAGGSSKNMVRHRFHLEWTLISRKNKSESSTTCFFIELKFHLH